MKIKANHESVIALREYASVMPVCVENIKQSTEKLQQLYNSVSENLGDHDSQFAFMLKIVRDAQKLAEEAIEELPKKLLSTANELEQYLITVRSI